MAGASAGPPSDAELAAITGDDPVAAFESLLAAHGGAFRAWLGAGFAGLSDAAVALAFACVVAPRLRPWGAAPPTGWDLAGLLRAASLTCDQYVALALRLFDAVRPPGSRMRVSALGWRGDSAVGNHAQLAAWEGSQALLLDPTVGVVAACDLARRLADGALGPVPIAALPPRPVTESLRGSVLRALDRAGRLRPRDLLYVFRALEPDRISLAASDFVAAAETDGTQAVCLTAAGELRGLDGAALVPRDGWVALARDDRRRELLALNADGALCAVRDGAVEERDAGIDALVAGG